MAMLASQGLSAQDCEPEHSSTDEFSGTTIHLYGGTLGNGGSLWYGYSFTVSAYIYKESEQNRMVVWMSYYQGLNDASVNTVDIPEGSLVRLKTAGGLREFTVSGVSDQKRKTGSKVRTTIMMSSAIGNDDLEHLSIYPIEMFQITPVGKESMTGEVTTRKGEHFQQQVWCFLNSKPSTPLPGTPQKSKSRELEQGCKYLEPSFGLAYTGIHGRFEYFVQDKVSLGGGMGYAFGSRGGLKLSLVYFAPIIRYYAATNSTTGLYMGLSLGYASGKQYIDSPYVGRVEEPASGLYYDIHVGVKHKIASKLFLLGELGVSKGSLLRVGVAVPL